LNYQMYYKWELGPNVGYRCKKEKVKMKVCELKDRHIIVIGPSVDALLFLLLLGLDPKLI